MGSYKPAQVTVLFGNTHTWVSFKDEYDVELGFSGRTYRDPDQVHLDRLARAVNNVDNNCRVTLDFSGNGPQIVIHRDAPRYHKCKSCGYVIPPERYALGGNFWWAHYDNCPTKDPLY